MSDDVIDDIPRFIPADLSPFIKEPPKPKPKPKFTRKKKTGRKRKKGNRKQTVKNWKWSAVCIRVEHFAFLRELRKYYKATYSKVLATLVVEEYCKILRKVDPVKATQIRKAYESERYSQEIIKLDD